MKSAMRPVVVAAVISFSVVALGWSVGTDVIGAQGTHKPTIMKRIYAGTDGLSHVEDIPLDAEDCNGEDHRGAGQRVAARQLQRLASGWWPAVHHQFDGRRANRGGGGESGFARRHG